jgi:hypothetical protein
VFHDQEPADVVPLKALAHVSDGCAECLSIAGHDTDAAYIAFVQDLGGEHLEDDSVTGEPVEVQGG